MVLEWYRSRFGYGVAYGTDTDWMVGIKGFELYTSGAGAST